MCNLRLRILSMIVFFADFEDGGSIISFHSPASFIHCGVNTKPPISKLLTSSTLLLGWFLVKHTMWVLVG